MTKRWRDSATILIPNLEVDEGPILIVDDDGVYTRILRRHLESAGHRVNVAKNGAEALLLAEKLKPDIIMSDVMMPTMDGLVLCETLRADDHLRYTYVILLSSRADLRAKVEGLESGADDFLAKDVAVEELLARVRTGYRIRGLQKALIHQAATDGLTGLANRAHFFERLKDVMRHGRDARTPTTLAMIDLDGLKRINDTQGHVAGDKAIRHAGRLIRDHCRASDIVSRYGGDEFAVLLPDASYEESTTVMNRIVAAFERDLFRYEDHAEALRISWGLTTAAPGEWYSSDEFVRRADDRLYSMKHVHHAMVAELHDRAVASEAVAEPAPEPRV